VLEELADIVSSADTTPTITMESVTVSLSELALNDNLVSVDITSDTDFYFLGFGAILDNGLTMVDWSKGSASVAMNGNFLWYSVVYSTYVANGGSAGTVDTLIFEVTPEVGVYYIETTVYNYYGDEIGTVNGIVPTVVSGYIEVVDDGSDVPIATDTTVPVATPTITMGSTTVSLSDLEASNYLVDVDVYVDVDYYRVAFGAWLDEGLTLDSCNSSYAVAATNGQMMWYAWIKSTEEAAGVIDTLTFEMTPEVGIYYIETTVYNYSGNIAGDVNSVIPNVVSGYIEVVDDTDVPVGTDVTDLDPSSDMSTASQIYAGEAYRFDVDGGSANEKYFYFIPEETGSYTFYTENDVDTVGKLYDSDGTLLISDDDSGDNNNFYISVTLEVGEIYYIGVRGYDTSDTGTVILYVTEETIEYEYDLKLDTEYNISLDGEMKWYRFIPEETGIYKFYTTYGTSYLDTYCYLYDSAGEYIAYNDDGGEGYNFRLMYTLNAGEIYYIAVGAFDSGKANLYVTRQLSEYKYTILDDGTIEITDYYGSAADLEIPSEIDGYTVTSIGESAFYDCDSLISVSIPDSVTSIGYYAFEWSGNLTSVVISESVTSIGWEPFYGCYSLTAIIVDDNNSTYSSIDGVLFDKNLETLISCPWGKEGEYAIPDSVTSIGSDAFGWCENLTSVVISDSVTSIGNGAFYYCTSLTDITIPDSVISIGSEAFECCYSLTSITFLNPDCEIYDFASTICNGWEDVYDDDGYYSGDYCYYNGVIYGYDGSTAETYAETYGYTFVSLGETPALSTGDLDGDSEITV